MAMKQLTVVVRPFRADAVLQVIASLDIPSVSVREAKGFSRQKGYLDRYLGSEYSMAFLPKVEITCALEDCQWEQVVEKETRAARRGRIGDGKIFFLDLCQEEAIEF